MSDKFKEDLDQVSATRSVGMNLARRFNAGIAIVTSPRRVATVEFVFISAVATRREPLNPSYRL